ncbi:MAG TPA: hypothetical protein VN696_08865 [Pyrinomonadaceae bacterium]|nr:hypothetical protein [Pyrinomonadaceae bacterium]
MASEKNKWIDAVAKLLQLTQDRKLKWDPHSPPAYLNLQSDRQRVEVVYETRFNEKPIRLYQTTYKVERPRRDPYSFTTSLRLNQIGGFEQPELDYPYWAKKTVLELLDESGFGAWTFPQSDVLDDLFDAVTYQVAGVKEFLDEILAVAS